MAETKILTGFLIGMEKRGDNGALLLLLSENGFLYAVGSSANRISKKSFPISSCIGCLARFDLRKTHADGPWSCLGYSVIKPIADYSKDLETAAFFLFLSESIKKLFVQEEENIYTLYEKVLELVGKQQVLAACCLFLSQAISVLGVGPNTRSCLYCGSHENLTAFSLKSGGFLCANCMYKSGFKKMERKELLSFRYVFEVKLEDAKIEKLDYVFMKNLVFDMVQYLEDYFGLKFECFKMFWQSL